MAEGSGFFLDVVLRYLPAINSGAFGGVTSVSSGDLSWEYTGERHNFINS